MGETKGPKGMKVNQAEREVCALREDGIQIRNGKKRGLCESHVHKRGTRTGMRHKCDYMRDTVVLWRGLEREGRILQSLCKYKQCWRNYIFFFSCSAGDQT